MKTTNLRLIMVAGLAGALAAAVGCGGSSSSSDSGAKGGSGGGAGKGGSGGGSGGSAGGGSGGSDAGQPGLVNHTFTTSGLDGFILNDYPDPNRRNLAGNYPTDGGVDGGGADGGTTAPTLVWDGTDGNPSAGSLKVTATWTGYDQYVDAVVNQPTAPTPMLLDLSGKTLHAMVRLDSATLPPGFGVQLHASTGATFNSYGNSAYTTLTMGTWVPLTLDVSGVTSAMWAPTMVVQIGVQISSGGVPADAGAFPGPLTVTVSIDTITD